MFIMQTLQHGNHWCIGRVVLLSDFDHLTLIRKQCLNITQFKHCLKLCVVLCIRGAELHFDKVYMVQGYIHTPGKIGVVSRSGTLTYEVGNHSAAARKIHAMYLDVFALLPRSIACCSMLVQPLPECCTPKM